MKLIELLIICSASTAIFLGLVARPIWLGLFRPLLGHASEEQLRSSANQTAFILGVVTAVSLVVDSTGPSGWQKRLLVGTLSYAACYALVILRTGR